MKKRKYSSPYLSRDYFSKELLPHDVYAGRKTIRQPIPYRQHEYLEFLLVRSGEGTVTVNARSYPACRGSLFCFGPDHFHKLELDKGGRLETSECHVNPGLFFYVSACPYYRSDPDRLPAPPLMAQLDEALTQQVTQLMDKVAAECEKGPVSENQPICFHLLKLFGILEKYAVTK